MRVIIQIAPNGIFPYKEIKVNNTSFHLTQPKNNHLKYYQPAKSLNGTIDRMYSVEGILGSLAGLENFVAREISVNNIPFERRCENFFTPQHLSEHDIVSFFNLIASRYETLIDNELNAKLINRIFKRIINLYFADKEKHQKKLNVLDYGTGTGLSYEVYHNKKSQSHSRLTLFGCDISEKMLELCKLKGFDNTHLCKYAETNYPSNYFDAIFATFVAHYFVDEKPFREILRILKPGGLFIFNTKWTTFSSPHQPSSRNFTRRGTPEPYYASSLSTAGFSALTYRVWRIKSLEKERLIKVYQVGKFIKAW